LPKKHVRLEKTISVPLADIEAGPFDHDPQYASLFKKELEGAVPTSLTRLSEGAITSGFFARRNGKTVHISNLESEFLPIIIAEIRGGWRPRLSIYWNSLAPTASKYVCPDDELPLAAYRRLGIRLVPCSIINPKPFASAEAAIWIKSDGDSVNLARTVPPSVDGVLTLKMSKGASFSRLAELLIQECAKTRKTIKKFHLKNREKTNYHHVLYAALRRQERIIDSISQLVSLQRAEHAAALVRVSYEAFLNFYIDWISPSFFGPRLQLLSLIRDA
jgi:hypothetical protein